MQDGTFVALQKATPAPSSERIPKVPGDPEVSREGPALPPPLTRPGLPAEGVRVTVVSEVGELARQAEELRAWKAVRVAAGDLGRARRYKWPADKQDILEETLAAARARLAAVKDGGETYDR
jgi:hypothetical protein